MHIILSLFGIHLISSIRYYFGCVAKTCWKNHNSSGQSASIPKAFKVSALNILIAEIIIFEPNAYPQQLMRWGYCESVLYCNIILYNFCQWFHVSLMRIFCMLKTVEESEQGKLNISINVQSSSSLLMESNKNKANEMRVIRWRSDEVPNQQIGWLVSLFVNINQTLTFPDWQFFFFRGRLWNRLKQD